MSVLTTQLSPLICVAVVTEGCEAVLINILANPPTSDDAGDMLYEVELVAELIL
jgi:hypothetical protein